MSTLLPWSLFLINTSAIILCLIHCWRRHEIYQPYQFPSITVRLFWTVLLITFSPIAWISYSLFGLFFTNKETRTAVFHTIYTILLIPCCILLILEKFPQQKTINSPVTINLKDKDRKEDSLNRLSYHTGTSDIKTNTSSSASTMSTNHSLFSFRRLALVVDNNHPIITGTVPLLIEQLQKTGYVDEILILNSHDDFSRFATMPDYWMSLHLDDIQESGLNVYKSIKADVHLDFTLHPYNAIMRFYQDEFSFPTSHIEVNAKASINAKLSVFGTADAVYQDVCRDIAKVLTKSLVEKMNEMISKYGQFPDITYLLMTNTIDNDQPYVLFNEDYPVLYGKRPLIHSIAYQKIPNITPVSEYLETCIEQLELDGWEIKDSDVTTEHHPRIKAQKDQWKVIVYGEKPKLRLDKGMPVQDYKTMPMDIYIEYMHVLTEYELDQKYQSILLEESPAELLIYFQNTYRGSKFREKFYQLLQRKSKKNPITLYYLAKMEKDPNIKHKQLYQAYYLNKMISDPKNSNNQIEKEIKELEEKHSFSNEQINWEELCNTIAAKPIIPDESNSFTASVSYNEPVAFYWMDEENMLQFIAASVIANNEYPQQAGLRIVNTKNGTSSWGSSHESRQHINELKGQPMIFVAQLEVENPNHFYVTVRLEPDSTSTQ